MRFVSRAARAAFVVAVGGLGGSSAFAVATVSTNNTSGTYPVSNGDLLNGLTPATTGTFGPLFGEMFAGTNPAILTDGAFGSANPNADTAPPSTLAVQNGATLTYTFDTTANTLGYSLSAISTYGGWQDGGRDRQTYDVLYSTVSDPATFLPLATVDFEPTNAGQPSNTRVELTDPSGVLATSVKSLRFNFGVQENGQAGYREIDVVGAAVAIPEPASLGVLAVAGLGLLARRRRAS
jgi:hypothetical protein